MALPAVLHDRACLPAQHRTRWARFVHMAPLQHKHTLRTMQNFPRMCPAKVVWGMLMATSIWFGTK